MKSKPFLSALPAFLLAASISMVSCNKTGDLTSQTEVTPPANEGTVPLNSAVSDHPGRTLAANCFMCHGTNGYAGELKIASMGATEIINKFNYYRTKNPKDDIMYLHAQTYTDAEIALIADFFSRQ